MAYQRVPETVQITIKLDCDQEPVSNVYYAEKFGGYTQGDIDGIAAQIDSVIGPVYKAAITVYDHYLSTVVRGLDQENDLTATVTTAAGVGSVGQAPYPPNIAFCLTQRSGLTGRSARGRIYFPCIREDARNSAVQSTDLLQDTHANAYLAAVDAVRSTIENYGAWRAVLVSRYHAGAKRSVGELFPWISTDYTTLKFSTRRSRHR